MIEDRKLEPICTGIDLSISQWNSINPDRANEILSQAPFDWALAGGWAIDLFLGRITRAHKDFDILVPRSQQLQMQAFFDPWDMFVSDPPGSLRPWTKNEYLGKPLQDIWLRPDSKSPWTLQVMLFDESLKHWIYRRNSRTQISDYGAFWQTPEGLRVLNPEIQLLFKAKEPRAHDQSDFENLLPHLSDQKKCG